MTFKVAKQNGMPALTIKDEADNEVPTVDRKGKFISKLVRGLKAGVTKYRHQNAQAAWRR
jgi:isoleucyl-tRNA synthetase